MDPNGRKPAMMEIEVGSKYHFLSGIGRGTTLILHGMSAWPLKLRPRSVPIKLSGRITNKQMAMMAS